MILDAIRRIGVLAVTALTATVIVFLLLSVLPGDPARAQLGVDATDAQVAALRSELGLDRPLLTRYGHWLLGLLRGDLGESYLTRQSVTPEVVGALEVTLILVLAGMVIAVLIAIPLGTLSAVRQGRPDGVVLAALSRLGISIPNFVMALLLVLVFAVGLRWLPSGGWVAPIQGPWQFLERLILPALSLGIVRGAILARYTRSAVLDVQREDFMRTAQAKGMTGAAALWRHGLRNALVPVLTVTGVEFSGLLIGAVVIESVFVIPGLGALLLRAVSNRDMGEVQAIVIVVVIMVLLINALVDLAHTLVDPRMRSAS